jgi:hypothetical protein
MRTGSLTPPLRGANIGCADVISQREREHLTHDP